MMQLRGSVLALEAIIESKWEAMGKENLPVFAQDALSSDYMELIHLASLLRQETQWLAEFYEGRLTDLTRALEAEEDEVLRSCKARYAARSIARIEQEIENEYTDYCYRLTGIDCSREARPPISTEAGGAEAKETPEGGKRDGREAEGVHP